MNIRGKVLSIYNIAKQAHGVSLIKISSSKGILHKRYGI